MQTNETTLYTPDDLTAIQAQIRKRWLAVGLPCIALLALLIVSLVIRVEVITTLCTILIGAILIFCWDLLLKPLHCYRTHLQNVLHGRVHEVELPFESMSEDSSLVDGVYYYAIHCMDTDGKGRAFRRLFYFDAQKTRPDFTQGEKVYVLYHGLTIADIRRAE